MPPEAICRYCVLPLDDGRPYQVDLEGRGTHLDCLPTLEEEDDPDDE